MGGVGDLWVLHCNGGGGAVQRVHIFAQNCTGHLRQSCSSTKLDIVKKERVVILCQEYALGGWGGMREE